MSLEPPTLPAADDRALCAATAALLVQGASLHLLSCALTLAAALALLLLHPALAPAALLAAAVAAGAAQTYLALRVGFDAALFRLVATGALDWSQTDGALQALTLAPALAAPRPTASRAAGALRLLRRQGLALAAQALALLAAALLP